MTEERITKDQIEDAIKKGDLKDEILWHHFQEIRACGQSIQNLLDKLENEGFKSFEIYYAMLQHVYSMRFAFEDENLEQLMQAVDKEVFEKMLEHRRQKLAKEGKLPQFKNPVEK